MTVPESRVETPTRTITPSISLSLISIRESGCEKEQKETLKSLIQDEKWPKVIEIFYRDPSQLNEIREDQFLSVLNGVKFSDEERATEVYQLLLDDPKMDGVSKITLGTQTILKDDRHLATEDQHRERVYLFLDSVHIEKTPDRHLEKLKTLKVVQIELERRKKDSKPITQPQPAQEVRLQPQLNGRIRIVKAKQTPPPSRRWFCCI